MNIILFDREKIPESIPAGDDKAIHILKILKLKEGDRFKCGLVNGNEYTARIERIDAGNLTISWEKTSDMKKLYPATLLVGYTRPVSSKRILREAASLGVERIIFTGTDVGEKSYRESTLWKSGEYRTFLINGAQQAASTAIPDILFFSSVKTAMEAIPPESETDLILMDNIEPKNRLSEFIPAHSSAILAIGSERGWSDRERKLFSNRGFASYSLGNRILRTETACSAGLAVLLSGMGYM